MDESQPMNAAAMPMLLHRLKGALALAPLLLVLAAVPARAGDLHGRFELTDLGSVAGADSLDASLGDRFRNDFLGDVRLTWEPKWDNWDFSVHYEASADVGGTVKLMRDEAPYFAAPPPATLFDLTNTIAVGDETLITQKIDRLSLGYTAPNFVIRVGRQALTWGAGMMFHPMDLVDPFAPDTVDTEYKPGVDMAYLQWLFHDGSDLQLIAVPRPVTSGGPPTWDASTFALHYHKTLGELDTTWLLARDHGDWTGGLGLSGPLGGAVWNAEIVPTVEADGTVRISGLANISSAVTLFDRNATVFAEYYHNGFGVTGSGTAFDMLPVDLADRLARGQVFNVSQDYLTGGMTLEWTPLLTLSPSIIANLNDGSFYAAAEIDRSVSDNADLIAGAQVPIGPTGTEYGGLPLSGSTAPYVAAPITAYLQFRRHF